MLHSQDESEVVLQPPTDIEILLDLVKDSSTLRTKDDQKRLDDFLANKARQQKLLNDARWLLTKEKNREKVLTKTFEDNDKRLSDLEEQLNLKVGISFFCVEDINDFKNELDKFDFFQFHYLHGYYLYLNN